MNMKDRANSFYLLPAALMRRQEVVGWPEDGPGLCGPENDGSGSAQCHSSASDLPEGLYQH